MAQAGIGFPDGTASTARVTGYARGLQAAGEDVLVLCLGTSEPSPPETPLNTEVRGVAHGVAFEYTCGSTARSTSFWRRRWSRVRGLAGAARTIHRLRAAGPVEAVLLYSQSSLDAAAMRLASRRARALYIVDVCEMPFHTLKGVRFGKLRKSLYDRTFFRWFNAAIVISEPLRRHVARFGARGTAILTAPVMVDTDVFRPREGAVDSTPLVTYCGLLNQDKDGVVTLMEAFRSVAQEVPDVMLQLVGDTYHGTCIPEFRAIADELGVAERVTFAGTIARSEIPGCLVRASVLALARPRSPQADTGMPTKVAEYLASGVPTVLTQVGEISRFLENGVSAYLVPPDDVPALAEALRRVLLNRDEAVAVGLRGRDVAVRHFDQRVVGARVAVFVHQLSDRTAEGAA